jgi:AcrR family transcriptional regulator
VAAKGASKSKLRKDDGRLVRGRKSRARIREAALSLFRERGFDGATLRAIAERAGMGASSIYRHVQSKEELLIDELSQMQEEAWSRFRVADDRNRPPAERLLDFFDVQHELLVENRDLTTIALRATTKTEARVAKRVLQLYDRTIGLLMEILQHGRMKKHLARDVDVLETARVLFHVTNGARIPWANGMVADDALRDSIHQAVYLLFRGVSAQPLAPSAPSSSPSPSLPSSPSSSLPQTEAPPGLAGAAGVPAESPTPRRAGLLTDPR